MSKSAFHFGQGFALAMDRLGSEANRAAAREVAAGKRPPRWSSWETAKGQWYAGVDTWESSVGPYPTKAEAIEALKSLFRREGYSV